MDPNASGLIERYDSPIGFALLHILVNGDLCACMRLNRVLGNAR